MKEIIKESFKFFKENILKIAIILGIIFIVVTMGSFTFYGENKVIATKILESFVEATKDMMELQNGDLSIAIMFNNIRACLITIVLGIVPFLFLTIFVMLLNAGVIGAVLSVNTSLASIPVWKVILFGLLPHGIFELPALFISMAISVFICIFLTKKLLGKEKRKFGKTFLNLLLNVVLIVIPLLIVAGIVEGIVTPVIMTTFMK